LELRVWILEMTIGMRTVRPGTSPEVEIDMTGHPV